MPNYLNNERGVAFVLEIILLAVVLSAIGFAGYSYLSHKSASTSLPGKIVASPKSLPAAHNAFGFALLKSLHKASPNENLFISPTSVSLALAMAFNGASGDTKTAMAKTLAIDKLGISQINQESSAIIQGLKNPDPKVELAIANSVWADQKFAVKPDFIATLDKYYGAEAATLDFANPKSKDTINDWASDNTKGKIPTIIDNISPASKMFLINATYFKGSWTTEFNKAKTTSREFTPPTGGSVSRPTMVRGGKMSYAETDDLQSVSLTYGDNKRLSMQVILPKKLNSFVDGLSGDSWSKLMGSYSEMPGTLYLPKFKLEYEKSLNDALKSLGMGVAFSDIADFSGISPSLAISQVKHKTYLDVNEEGTEAAAVTSVDIMTTSVGSPQEKSFYMDVNRPFFVAIRDSQTGEVLFAGLIQKP